MQIAQFGLNFWLLILAELSLEVGCTGFNTEILNNNIKSLAYLTIFSKG